MSFTTKDFTDMSPAEKREWLQSLHGVSHDLQPHPLSDDELFDLFAPAIVAGISFISAAAAVALFVYQLLIR